MEDSIKYFRELQRNCSSQLYGNLEEVLMYRKKQLNLNDKKLKKIVKKFKNRSFLKYEEKLYNQKIAKPFLDVLPLEVSEKLRDVYIGILPTYKINASATKAPHGKPIIKLHCQLMTAIAHYNETQMLYGEISKNSEANDDFLCKSYLEICNCFIYQPYLPKMSLLPPLLNQEKLQLVYRKTFLHELFIIAHEYAHIYLGHLEIKTEDKTLMQKCELDADLQAVKWIFEAINNKKMKGFQSLPYYFAIEIFVLFHILEVNSSTYNDDKIITDLHKKLTPEEYCMRKMNLINEYINLINKDLITNDHDHPKAVVRLVNILVNTKDLIDEEGQRFLLGMLHNVVYYETFKLNS
ncbi:hypothetical protein [Desulfosporosinus hippei]|uniref:Peptidase U49 n=1 Tax=Desulfosporosinus hippei DSM 8344 TaxID=1121419 RepID=A0A1G7Z4D7_9FIRM|nr:hypothetical protein [Desulfosporosinus hippei]SDH03583.1 hypothetical protein SAMN05443529_1095 [Desulfosporosinus hippei DSM 8344]